MSLGKENKAKQIAKTIWNYSLVRLWLLCFVIVYIIECCGRHSLLGGARFFLDTPFRYIMNVFLIMTPYTVFYMIRKRSIGYVLVSFAWLGFGITNGVVLAFRVTPFSTVDFRLVDAALGVMGNYLEIWQVILIAVLAVLAFAVVVFLVIKIKKYTGKMHYVRNAICIAAYWIAMYFGMKSLVHAGVFSTVLPNLTYAYQNYGASYCFVVTGMRNGIRKPIDYSQNKMEAIQKGIEKPFKNEKINDDSDKPNIVFLQLESFFDINKVKNYHFNDNPVPYFTYLKKHYSSGYLTVPAFGAGTANTEFEVMTGMNLKFFSPGEYPYKTVLRKHTCESAAYDLANIGYGTHAIHNNTATFYTRYKVFTNLGYDSFSTIETMDSKDTTPTGWAKDRILTNQIMDALESTPNPDYIYTISVQGHGDYYKESARVDDPEITVTNITEKQQESAVNYYVEQIREMDDFVKQLCERIQQFDEKTVLVLYGDHLPGLGFTNEDLKNNNVYQTEYVMFSNFDMKRKKKNLQAYQLSAEVMNRLNIHTGTIMRYHQRYKGKKNYLSNLRALQYDVLYGNQYVYNQKNPFLQTDMRFGVKDVEISCAISQQKKSLLYGSNFTQSSQVYVNGERVDDVQMISNCALSIPLELKDEDTVRVIQETAKERQLLKSNTFVYHTPEDVTQPATTEEATTEEIIQNENEVKPAKKKSKKKE